MQLAVVQLDAACLRIDVPRALRQVAHTLLLHDDAEVGLDIRRRQPTAIQGFDGTK